MAGLTGMLDRVVKGVRAWHTSPHDFDKFDLSKIGTGEGNQTFGHGLYFAENPKVSGVGGSYSDAFMQDAPEWKYRAYEALKRSEFDYDRAIAAARAQRDIEAQAARGGRDPRELNMSNKILQALESRARISPHVYEVDIKADPSKFLDWHAPLSEQPAIRQAIEGALGPLEVSRSKVDWSGDLLKANGRIIAEYPKGKLSDDDPLLNVFGHSVLPALSPTPEKQMATLLDAGIPGIKYFDSGSRGRPLSMLDPQIAAYETRLSGDSGLSAFERGDMERALRALRDERTRVTSQTRNYVVGDDSLVDIVRKYGLPGIPAAGVATGMFGSLDPEGM